MNFIYEIIKSFLASQIFENFDILNAIIVISLFLLIFFNNKKNVTKYDQATSHIRKDMKFQKKATSNLSKRIRRVEKDTVAGLHKVVDMLGQLLTKTLPVVRSSPLRLTEFGHRLLDDAKIKNLIESEYQNILNKLDISNLRTETEKSNYIINTLSNYDFSKFSFNEKVVNYVEKRNDLILIEYKEIIAVYFRDLFFEKNNLIVDDVED